MSNITRYRADDYPERGTIRSGGVPLDIVGCTFLMTVNRVAKPVDTSDQVFQSIGEIVAPSTNGQVEFPITGLTDPGEYFFDMEMIDTNGKTKTFKDGEYIVLQDITKSDEETTILLDSFGVDGTEMEVDGNGEPWVTHYIHGSHADPDTYLLAETRGSRRVVRWKNPEGFGYTDQVAYLRLAGTVFPVRWFNPLIENIEAAALFYLDEAQGTIRLDMPGIDHWVEGLLKIEANDDASMICGGWVTSPNKIRSEMYFDVGSPHAGEGPGWYWSKLFVEKGWLSVRARYWKDGDDEPATWETSATPNTSPSYPCQLSVNCTGSVAPLSAAHVGDCAVVKFRTWR